MTTAGHLAVYRYVASSHHYLENALVHLQANEASKAGEFLWGAIAESLHALAASRNINLRTHKQLRQFVGALSKELQDNTISLGFKIAEALHSNYYEAEYEVEDVEWDVDPIRQAIDRTLILIPPELMSQPEEDTTGTVHY